jgi:hypothetical protein
MARLEQMHDPSFGGLSTVCLVFLLAVNVANIDETTR